MIGIRNINPKSAYRYHTEQSLSAGRNILMHDRKWTAEAMPDIVKGLRHKGYTVIDPRAIKDRKNKCVIQFIS